MDEHWETLTFGDLRPGDTVKLDEEGPEETVRTFKQSRTPDLVWFRTDLSVQWVDSEAPVLVRHPRPEVGQ